MSYIYSVAISRSLVYMESALSRLAATAIGALVLGLGFVLWLRPGSPTTSINNRVSSREMGDSMDGHSLPLARRGWSHDRPDGEFGEDPDEPSVLRFATQAGPEPGETTPRWSDLTPSERLTRLEAQFDTSIDEFESGDPNAANRAEAALTALRSELYTTPEGRERYAALESRLQALTENE